MKTSNLIASLAFIIGAATVPTFANEESRVLTTGEIMTQIQARLTINALDYGNQALEITGIKGLYEMLPSTQDIHSRMATAYEYMPSNEDVLAAKEYAVAQSKGALDFVSSDEYWPYVFSSISLLYVLTGNNSFLPLPLMLLESYKHGIIDMSVMSYAAEVMGAYASTLLCMFAAKTGIYNTGLQLGSGQAYSAKLAQAIAYFAYYFGMQYVIESKVTEGAKSNSFLPESLKYYL